MNKSDKLLNILISVGIWIYENRSKFKSQQNITPPVFTAEDTKKQEKLIKMLNDSQGRKDFSQSLEYSKNYLPQHKQFIDLYIKSLATTGKVSIADLKQWLQQLNGVGV